MRQDERRRDPWAAPLVLIATRVLSRTKISLVFFVLSLGTQ
jgi:hypothetical protein